jgi:hypothetical protein
MSNTYAHKHGVNRSESKTWFHLGNKNKVKNKNLHKLDENEIDMIPIKESFHHNSRARFSKKSGWRNHKHFNDTASKLVFNFVDKPLSEYKKVLLAKAKLVGISDKQVNEEVCDIFVPYHSRFWGQVNKVVFGMDQHGIVFYWSVKEECFVLNNTIKRDGRLNGVYNKYRSKKHLYIDENGIIRTFVEENRKEPFEMYCWDGEIVKTWEVYL